MTETSVFKFYREFSATNLWCIKTKQFVNTSASDFSIVWLLL